MASRTTSAEGVNLYVDQEPKFVTDRWIGPKVAQFFYSALREDVIHVDKQFRKQPIADVVWLRWAAGQGRAALTADKAIARNPAELAVIKECGNVVFIWDMNNASTWDRFEVLVRSWRNIKAITRMTMGPAVFRIGPRGVLRPDPDRYRIEI